MFRYLSLALTSGLAAVCLATTPVTGNHLETRDNFLAVVDEEKAVKSVVLAHFDALREGKPQDLATLWDMLDGVYSSAMLGDQILNTMKASEWITANAAAVYPHFKKESLKVGPFKLVSPQEATLQVTFSMNGRRPMNKMTFTLKKFGSGWRIVKLVDTYLYVGC
jgi:hypothetical protein